MFPTFTGSSRKARNVNLSGQKPINPWASSTAGASAVAVKSAQAERQQRQREREKLKAAFRIQRSWRGYRVRRDFRASCRHHLNLLYQTHTENTEQRSIEALPLVLTSFEASRLEDHVWLAQVSQDLVQTKFRAFTSGAINPTRLGKLAHSIVMALKSPQVQPNTQPHTKQQTRVFFETLASILQTRPQALVPLMDQYYQVLGTYLRQSGPESKDVGILQNAVVAPLWENNVPAKFTENAYRQFAFAFLAQPELHLFERNIDSFAAQIDLGRLAESILAGMPKASEQQTPFLWLLAHFVALQKSKKKSENSASPSLIPKALYQLLSISSSQIRAGFTRTSKGSSEAQDFEEVLPPYVRSELASLVDRDEITRLLERFTLNHGKSSAPDPQDAGFLAGHILTLIYCFPALSDEIRMRLYLADIPSAQGRVPAVKLFWEAMSKTSIFHAILSNETAALDILRYKTYTGETKVSAPESKWHREWQTVLLFLELYVFVLRLMDDDDFFSALSPSASLGGQVSRVRSSGLPAEALQRLTLFLKHLSFTLYYNSADILEAAAGTQKTLSSLGDFLASAPAKKISGDVNDGNKSPGFVITAGIDFDAFRNLVTTAMKMLYERDSRRPFLPQRHWLMTSRFDMESFLAAVVLEEQRQRELREADEDDPDEDEMDLDEERISYPPSRHAQQATVKARQRKAARERMLAASGPKLEILRNMPFVIPFETRVQIFRQFIHLDKERRRSGLIDNDQWRNSMLNHGSGRDIVNRHHAEIKRGQVFSDALEQFWDLEDGLKEPIQITFVDEFGIPEAGIDGGGVTKEFLTSVTKEAFTQDQRLFITNSKSSYYPNPAAIDQQKEALRAAGIEEKSETWRESMADLLRQYEFLGRIIGKCMYEGILIDIVFAGFFLLKWASAGAQDGYNRGANINDLHELDEELYQGMLRLKNYDGNVDDLALDFTISDQVSLPGEPVHTISRNLIPDGENIPVTKENRPLYISYVARHRLAVQPHAQTKAFLRGLGLVIDPAWLSMFNQTELQRLVGGDSSEIDVEDLRRHTVYSGVYAIGDDGQEHETVKLFWEVMHGLADDERREVLKYVTSTPRAPLLGFGQLTPAFSIRDGGQDQERLPSASTCVNLLKLPQYRTKAVLRDKLLYAVKSGAGFDLS
ncbi:hypothetical protein B0H66DRAFT_292930 [Apodospora peruviana]|uniref:HECT-type E3 ubiquitin transferase n=1 Tax=Apodospora peruviana TaxID=516989 RepID=A0AAE0M289_9PEZI|nr:hypothetical protein B0H66DRAFT_292930 [Apodospora peruviana]